MNVNLDSVLTVLWGISAILNLITQQWMESIMALCLAIAHRRLWKGDIR